MTKKQKPKAEKSISDMVIPLSDNKMNLGEYRQPLEATDPEKAELVKHLLANGAPYRVIQDRVKKLGRGGIGMNTITRIKISNEVEITDRRKVAAMDAERLTELTRGAIEQRLVDAMDSPDGLEKIPVKELGFVYDISGKRGDALTGNASQIVEHREVMGIEQAQALIDQAKIDVAKKAQVIDAEIVEE
jgi:hypothetical protein